MADKLNLKGWKRTVFICGLTAVATAAAATIGYFIGPYIPKVGNKILDSLKSLIKTTCCFKENTKILTVDGFKDIVDVKVGDFVYAKNIETGQKVEKKVKSVFSRMTDEIYYIIVNNEKMEVTGEHPFWVKGRGWISASLIHKNDEILTYSEHYETVQAIEFKKLDTAIRVYNFEVEDFHTYFVGSNKLLVHNKCSLNKISDSYLKRKGFDAHAIKREILGRNAPISQYDLFYDKSTGAIFVLKKGSSEAAKIVTGYFIK